MPALSFLIAVLYVVANIVQAARIYNVFWPDTTRAAFIVQAVVTLGYTILAFYRGNVLVALGSVLVTAFLTGAHLVFVTQTGAPASFNIVATYLPILAFVVIRETKLPPGLFFRIVAVVSTLYIVSFIALNDYIIRSWPPDGSILLNEHSGDGYRVYFVGAYALFVAFCALRDRQMAMALRILLAVLAGTGILLSGTRAFLAIAALVVVLSPLIARSRPFRIGLLSVIYGGMAVLLLGLFVLDWNPFFIFTTDQSALTRAEEYRLVTETIRGHWLTGVGLATDPAYLRHYLGLGPYDAVYASDLGVLGPFFDFGVAGLVAMVGAVYFALTTRRVSTDPVLQAMQLVCVAGALYAIISPMILIEPSAIFLMGLLAVVLRQRGRGRHRRAPFGVR